MPDLGLIVIDEEHDASFKQQEGFRYSARDIAIYRAKQAGITALLGSATPSMESLAHALSGRYGHLVLSQRAGNAKSPARELIDIRSESLEGGMSARMLREIGLELGAGHQVLVFLNRRGWAPVLMCHDCGWTANCSACDARMTLHREAGQLWCHHCDRRRHIPDRCQNCKSTRIASLGQGTERCEHLLRNRFTEFPVMRIDRGTTQRRDAFGDLLRRMDGGEAMILVGTQMLAKGHHFPNVTLVAVLDADTGLFSSEHRALERTSQLLEQVAGRAGRDRHAGRVLIQTHHVEHPVLRTLVDHGYGALARQLLTERRQAGLPPFGFLALLWFESSSSEDGPEQLCKLRLDLEPAHPIVDFIGPIPAPLRRRAGRFRDQLVMRAARRGALHEALSDCCAKLEGAKLPSRCRWMLDIDPLEGV